eukprot:TRINITY_DN2108_c0_g1_i1.p1 TRINITY_DN2108_c0_g1~~TRINITY_DN2108_c0_g1_i1.p1  ORF type:complete len:120 (-),score=18.08 TRINITY_DN2108_c0_g1_i1:266-625(-)
MKIADILLRILGLAACCALIVNGLFCFKICSNKDYRDYIVSSLLILFGGVLGFAEIGLACLTACVCGPFAILSSRLVRGIFYIVSGSLAVTKLWWMLAIGGGTIGVGVLNIIFGLILKG